MSPGVVWLTALLAMEGQAGQAVLQGCVRGWTDEVVPGIDVTVEAAGQTKRTVVTNAAGCYSVGGLPLDSYKVSFSAEGFRRREVAVQLKEAGAVALDVVLPIEDRFVVLSCICDPLVDEPPPQKTVKPRDIWLVDPNGQPVPGAELEFSGLRVETTDASGHVCIEATDRQGFRATDERFKAFFLRVCCLPADGRITIWP